MSWKKNKRRRIYKKFNGKCAYCGCDITFGNFDIDHVIPKSDGGSNEDENLFPTCKTCNASKGVYSVEQFRERLQTDLFMRDPVLFKLLKKYHGYIKTKHITFHFEREVDYYGKTNKKRT